MCIFYAVVVTVAVVVVVAVDVAVIVRVDDDEDFDIYCRVAGEVERTIDLLTAVRSAGSWRRFSNEPRRQVLILQKLAAAKRASPPASMARLFSLTPELLWVVLRYWRTARDPLYSTVQRMP